MALNAPRILLVDSYDSFTHNLAALCRRSIPNCQIHIVKNDELSIQQLRPHLKHFSAVVVGPGPGSPDNPADIGVVCDLWHLDDEDILPIFGVCLGLQSLGIEFGAELKRLHAVKHGQISQIHHAGTEIFKGVGDTRAVRYHSLHVTIPSASEIQQLAWAQDEENGRVVMAIKHSFKPFWAVQYHPESVCTDDGGWGVLRNFWTLATSWSESRRSPNTPDPEFHLGTLWPHIPPTRESSTPSEPRTNSVLTTKIQLPQLPLTQICEYFGAADEESKFVLLDSAANPGRFSIIGALLPNTLHVTHYVGDTFVSVSQGESTTSESLDTLDVWGWLANYMRPRHVHQHESPTPFWGGFVGYFSYEVGYPILQIPLQGRKQRKHPDVNLVFVERSVVVDNETKEIHIQSLIPNDEEWIGKVARDLTRLSRSPSSPTSPRSSSVLSLSPLSSVRLPDKQRYISRIKQALEHLYAGDSYELCLTAQTRISIPYNSSISNTSTSWERYQSLRKSNPAPHSAYFRLHPTTLMSSSPERFLSFSRPPNPMCQLRPIKGTVRKGPGITRAVAEELLAGSPKEVAENLMIVDLIRHDLHGALGENVNVTKFCGVEEYETVWQLVSVIEGTPGASASRQEEFDLGWNVLKSSFPPGSMTGAPKKRSVEILQNLEDGEREVYSGVFGYWCVGGSGDWSVTIRSCFKYEDAPATKTPRPPYEDTATEEWAIGAGGAITALSDPEAEWDEMVLKLQSVLRSFGITPPLSS
ncbi:hypothetical protein H1R20_g6593, partial [Candolleomyces eurysporus]